MEKFPFASADTAFVVPLTVTVANGTALPSGFVTFPVIVLLCAIMIMAGKQNSTSSKIFFMQFKFLLEEYDEGSKMQNNASSAQVLITEA